MDDGDPRGHIAPCLLREAHRQSAISHLVLFIRSLEHLYAVSRGLEQDRLGVIIQEAQALKAQIETF